MRNLTLYVRVDSQYLYDVILTCDLNSLLAVIQRSEDGVTSPGNEERHTRLTRWTLMHNGTDSAPDCFSFFVFPPP